MGTIWGQGLTSNFETLTMGTTLFLHCIAEGTIQLWGRATLAQMTCAFLLATLAPIDTLSL